MERPLKRLLLMEKKSERAYLNRVPVLHVPSILDPPAVHPGAVAAFEVFENESLSLPQDKTMVSRNHAVQEPEVAFLVSPYDSLVCAESLLDFLPVGPHYGQVEHVRVLFTVDGGRPAISPVSAHKRRLLPLRLRIARFLKRHREVSRMITSDPSCTSVPVTRGSRIPSTS